MRNRNINWFGLMKKAEQHSLDRGIVEFSLKSMEVYD